MKTNKLYVLLINWDGIDRTEPNTVDRSNNILYFSTNEGCDILGYMEGYYREQGWRTYCFTTRKQAVSLANRCFSQERRG